MAQFYSHITTRRTARPRNGRLLDAFKQGGSSTVVTGGTPGDMLWKQYTTTSGSAVISPVNGQLAALLFPGDVVAYSVNEEIPPVSFPIASYTTKGILSVKQGSGLFVNDGVLSLDPSVIGGGLDEAKLKEYLTANKYYNYQSQLTGYSIAAEYSPIKPTDTILTAFGKLEKNFSNYVDLKTNQTIDGVKTFKQTIFSQKDVVAYAVDGSVPEVSFPIASATTLGVIKVGRNLTVDDDGTLNGMDGGITSVSWGDITGALADQADLWGTLNNKVDKTSYTAADVLAKLKTVDGKGSGLDADLLDGLDSSIYVKIISGGPAIDTSGNPAVNFLGYGYTTGGWVVAGPVIAFGVEGFAKQIIGNYNNNDLYLRTYNNKADVSGWRTFAFTDSTVAAANKLATPRNLWGNSFNGEQNVGGDLLFNSTGGIQYTIYKNGSHLLAFNSNVVGGVALGYGVTDKNNLTHRIWGIYGNDGNISYLYYGGSAYNDAAMYILANKNIGIDIKTPNEKLEVGGNIKSSQNVIALGDVIAYSTGSTPSVSFPIASTTTLGVIKVGANLSIGADGALNALPSGITTVNWGMIEGSISAQADLQSALNAKLNASLYTAADVLSKLITVDGVNSNLDADLLDGKHLIEVGKYFDRIPYVAADGVMEIGKYLDFHKTSNDISDWSVRLYIDSESDKIKVLLPNKSGTIALITDTVANADKLDGYHSSSFAMINGTIISIDASNIPAKNVMGYGYSKDGWITNGPAIAFGTGSISKQICGDFNNNNLYLRTIYSDGGYNSDWRTFAFTDSTVEAAKKLATPRTIWGRSFNGEKDISGDIIVQTVVASGYFKTTGNANYTTILSSDNQAMNGYDADFRWMLFHGKSGMERGLNIWSYDNDGTVFNQVASFQSYGGNKFKMFGNIVATGDIVCYSVNSAYSVVPMASTMSAEDTTWKTDMTTKVNFLLEENARLRDEIYYLKNGGN